jgi:hypothetical protein
MRRNGEYLRLRGDLMPENIFYFRKYPINKFKIIQLTDL